MTETIAQTGSWLFQQAVVFPDTIITRQVPAGWFQQAVSVAQGLVSLAVLAILIAFIPLALRVHRAVERANAMLDRLQLQAGPLIARGEVIAADVQHITGTVRKDIQKISHTVGAANDRVMQAVRLTERRLNDFNTLLRMIQRELEQLFVGAAATMRGVRQGTHAFRDGPELASLEEDDDVFLDEFDYEEEEEITDADDVYDAAEDAPPIGPRIRRRR